MSAIQSRFARSRHAVVVSAITLAVGAALWGQAEAADKDKPQQPAGTTAPSTAAGPQGASTTAKPDKGMAARQAQSDGRSAVAFMIVPLAVATTDTMSKGCWARFYSDQDFKGDVLALSGPVALSDMGRAQPFWGEADSAVVGPKARITTYDNDGFNDQTAVLKPDQRIANLRDLPQLRWHEGIESVRLECVS